MHYKKKSIIIVPHLRHVISYRQAEASYHPVAPLPPQPCLKCCYHWCEHNGTKPRATGGYSGDKRPLLLKPIAYSCYCRDIHQTQPQTSQHSVGYHQQIHVGGEGGQEDGQAGHQSTSYASLPGAKLIFIKLLFSSLDLLPWSKLINQHRSYWSNQHYSSS